MNISPGRAQIIQLAVQEYSFKLEPLFSCVLRHMHDHIDKSLSFIGQR